MYPSMPSIIVNGEERAFPESLTVADLLTNLGIDSRRVAVEVNLDVIPRLRHPEYPLREGDRVEIAGPVGGGSGETAIPSEKPMTVGSFSFRSRLFTGTGKYPSYDSMTDCLAASGCEVTTVAVRREAGR